MVLVLESQTPIPPHSTPSGRFHGPAIGTRPWRVLGIASAGLFVVFLDATVVNIAFPALQADFHSVSRAGMSWVLNAYAVVMGALLVTSGRLADTNGRKKTFLFGLGLFAFASALCGLAPNVPLLVAARALQAVGAAALVPASLALILPEFPPEKRAAAVGIWGAAGAVAAAVGPSIGALLVEGPGWRWVFYVNVPFCAVAAWFGLRNLRESTAEELPARPDILGIVTVTAVFGLLSLGIVEGQQWGWGSAGIIGSFAAVAVLSPLLIVRSLAHPDPVLPVRLFARRSFSAAAAATVLFAAIFFANLLCNVLFITGVWHYSILRSALSILPGPLLAAAVAPLAGRWADTYGHRIVIVPGALIFGVGQVLLATSMTIHPDYVSHMLPGLVLVGLGIGITFPTLGAAGAHALPPAQYASGSAVVGVARQLGSILGVAVLIAILGAPRGPQVMSAFHHAWWVMAAAALGCAGVAGLIGSTKPVST